MKVPFSIFINSVLTQEIFIFWGLYKNNKSDVTPFTLFFTPTILFQLQPYNYKKSLSFLKKEYLNFASKPENFVYLVKTNLTYGKGGSTGKIILNFCGIEKFIFQSRGKLVICHRNLMNLYHFTKKILKLNKISFVNSELAPYQLLKALENPLYNFLNASNICCIFELKTHLFYVGSNAVLFKTHLYSHSVFKARTFKRLFSAYQINDNVAMNASCLVNSLRFTAERMLGKNNIQVESTIGGYGFKCSESQMREIIEITLLNPGISFNSCVTRIPSTVLSQIRPIN